MRYLSTRATRTITGSRIVSPGLLRAVKHAWVLAVALTAGLFILSLPRYFNFFIESERYNQYAPALAELNLTIGFLAGYMVLLDSLLLVISLSVALLIFFERGDDWEALILALGMVVVGVGFSPAIAQLEPIVGATLSSLAFILMIYAQCTFPDGSFRPRWALLLLLISLPFFLAIIPLQAQVLGGREAVNTIYPTVVLLGMSLLLIGIVAQVMRYRNYATPLQKQQTKIVVLGSGVTFSLEMLVLMTAMLPELAHPFSAPDRAVYTLPSLISLLVAKPIAFLSLASIPIASGLAITRRGLWDIDIVINRSLVYGAVTVILLGLFAAISLAFQQLLGPDQLALALLVGVVAAGFLLRPARFYFQRVIDRRVYGFRFDLNQLAKFNHPLNKPEVRKPGALTGSHIGVYEVMDIVGRGGMGDVYRGYHEGRTVAIKVLPEAWIDDEETRQRFIHEAETLALLKHPNIVPLHEHGAIGDSYYIVMDFVEGIELKDYLRSRAPLMIDEALPILRDVGSALVYAHERGLVHRDVKPSNIMLRRLADAERFHAMLLDFGVAKTEIGEQLLTGEGAIGTIDYMAPEQIKEARTVDHRADIYALGVVLYEMLTARRPFSGGPAQVMFAHIQQPPPDPRDLLPDIPRHVAYVVKRAMAKDVLDRFQSVGEMVKALEQA